MQAIQEQVAELMDEKSGRRKLQERKETLFHYLLQSDLPPIEKTATRLSREGIVVVGAGSETAGIAMSVSTFHLLDNPDKLSKLRDELVKALPDPNVIPEWKEVEKLPYLVRYSISIIDRETNSSMLSSLPSSKKDFGRWPFGFTIPTAPDI